MKTLLFLVVLSCSVFVISPVFAQTFQGKVVHVADGDTITVIHDGNEEKIRLYGVDTPEKKQDYGQQDKKFTADLVAGRVVEVDAIDTDRYGRTVGLVFIKGKNLNEELLRNGYAWQYKQYCKKSFCSDWLALERAASRSQRGLFADPYATPPWEWRKDKR